MEVIVENMGANHSLVQRGPGIDPSAENEDVGVDHGVGHRKRVRRRPSRDVDRSFPIQAQEIQCSSGARKCCDDWPR